MSALCKKWNTLIQSLKKLVFLAMLITQDTDGSALHAKKGILTKSMRAKKADLPELGVQSKYKNSRRKKKKGVVQKENFKSQP